MQDKGYFMKAKAKSHQLDMLHGSIWNKLPRFALPVAATAILEQLFNASDVAVVGNFAGDAAEKTAAVAAVGANTAIIGLIVNLFVGIALGANVVIANAIGRDDKDAVHRAVHTSILVDEENPTNTYIGFVTWLHCGFCRLVLDFARRR